MLAIANQNVSAAARRMRVRTVSPFRETAAYEALWATEGMTETKLASLFTGSAQVLRPSVAWSNFVAGKAGLFEREQFTQLMEKVHAFLLANLKSGSVVIHGDVQYPISLRNTKYPVELLYYAGSLDLARTRSISIVGARRASPDGMKRARSLARQLVERDVTIVSGLAAGIDTAALSSAIEAKGRVIGVIGTPINQVYPRENAELQQAIATDHLLLSQVPMYRYANEPFSNHKFYFPRRNITMAALSAATIIVEASETSGSHTQARACLAQGKKLFILDSCFQNPLISWPTKYLAHGAVRVTSISDIDHALGA
jgi:DNA processing protein